MSRPQSFDTRRSARQSLAKAERILIVMASNGAQGPRRPIDQTLSRDR